MLNTYSDQVNGYFFTSCKYTMYTKFSPSMAISLYHLPRFTNDVSLGGVFVIARALPEFHTLAIVVQKLSEGTLTSGYTFLFARAVSDLHVTTVGAARGTTLPVDDATGRRTFCEFI